MFGAQRVRVIPNPHSALEEAKSRTAENGAVVVSGSITLVGDILAAIQAEDFDDDYTEEDENGEN
jgi:folylpolyglutamate synthase/dihydropteroate synthase